MCSMPKRLDYFKTLNDPLDFKEGLHKTRQFDQKLMGIMTYLEVIDLPCDHRE